MCMAVSPQAGEERRGEIPDTQEEVGGYPEHHEVTRTDPLDVPYSGREEWLAELGSGTHNNGSYTTIHLAHYAKEGRRRCRGCRRYISQKKISRARWLARVPYRDRGRARGNRNLTRMAYTTTWSVRSLKQYKRTCSKSLPAFNDLLKRPTRHIGSPTPGGK